jgi:cell division protein FtsN
VSVRRGLPYLLVLLLGLSAGLLAACGSGGTKSGIPSASGGELKSQITDVGQAVDDGRCDDVEGQLKQVDRDIDQLPQTTDDQLVSALRDGADRLRRVSVEECEADAGTETTTTETTPTETTPTETVPEEEPTETLPTETTQTPTTTAPAPPPPPTGGTPPAPTPPPVTPPVTPTPPPVSPGGGVTPEIDPDG